MPSKYAATTKVPVERSRAEIEKTLERYGATKTFFAKDPEAFHVGFQLGGRSVQLKVPIYDNDRKNRQAMRVLLLWIKGRLEIIEAGFSTIDREFLHDILLASGQKVGDLVVPQLNESTIKSLPMPGGEI